MKIMRRRAFGALLSTIVLLGIVADVHAQGQVRCWVQGSPARQLPNFRPPDLRRV
jgi:hypothetical protein